MKSTITLTTFVLSAFAVLPIWLYLLYKILILVNASDLMWFMYYAYVPLSFIISALTALLKTLGED